VSRVRLPDETGIFIVLVVVLVVLSVLSPSFATVSNLFSLLLNGAVIAFLALGQTFVLLTGGIDLSTGATVAMTGVLAAVLMADGVPWPVAALLAVGAGLVLGVINGLLVHYVHVPPFIATFSTQGIAVAVPLIITGVFISWMLHISLIDRFSEGREWYRYVIVSSIMIFLSTFVYLFLRQFVPILHGWTFQFMRVINILALNAIIYMISNYILLIQTKRKLDVENEELKFVNLEARHKLLLNQINPHFLFNSIGTAKALIKNNKNNSVRNVFMV